MTYDPSKEEPVIRASICNGERVAGFRATDTGSFHEVMLVKSDADVDDFRMRYGITGDIRVIY